MRTGGGDERPHLAGRGGADFHRLKREVRLFADPEGNGQFRERFLQPRFGLDLQQPRLGQPHLSEAHVQARLQIADLQRMGAVKHDLVGPDGLVSHGHERLRTLRGEIRLADPEEQLLVIEFPSLVQNE